MAIVVTLAKIQQWLEQTKLTLSVIDPDLAESAREMAFSTLVNDYDTTVWVDANTTPKLVQSAISMLIAAWTYNRAYSEEGGAATYGNDLEAKAYALLGGIADGTIALEEYPGVGATAETLEFYPDDSTGALEVYDGLGYLVGLQGSEDIQTRVGMRF